MKRINKKLVIIMLSGFVLVTGCKKEEKVITNTITSNSNNTIDDVAITSNKESDVSVTSNNELDIIVSSNNIKTSNDNQNKEEISKDEEILNYITDFKKDIEKSLNSKEASKVKAEIIKKFITITDFIFYDKEINGIKFDSLKDETKKSVINSFNNLDELIETKFPNYKEELENKYIITSNLIKQKIEENELDIKFKETLEESKVKIKTNYQILKERLENK